MPGPRLSEQERYRIEAMWLAGLTFPQIAAELGRDRSTIWREVRRNHSCSHGVKHRGLTQKQARRADGRSVRGLYRWGYHGARAHGRARTRARRPRQVKLGFLLKMMKPTIERRINENLDQIFAESAMVKPKKA